MPLEKTTILNLDNNERVVASVNPASVRIDRSVPWERHKASRGNRETLEFLGKLGPATLSCEMRFKGTGTQPNVYAQHIERLTEFTQIPPGARDTKKHPPLCMFIWGDAFPRFKGVIEILATTYTSFRNDGTPTEAICEIRMREAADAKAKVRQRRRSPP